MGPGLAMGLAWESLGPLPLLLLLLLLPMLLPLLLLPLQLPQLLLLHI